MVTQIGTLTFAEVKEHPEHVAQPVVDALSLLPSVDGVGVADIDPNLSDTAAFCEAYQVRPDQAANCVVLEAKRGERTWNVACVILATTRADVNGLMRKTLDARRVSFAPMEQAVSLSGMEYGAITPVGLPNDWSIFVDKAVADSEYVILGSGVRSSKLAAPGRFLASLPRVQVLEGLGQPKTI